MYSTFCEYHIILPVVMEIPRSDKDGSSLSVDSSVFRSQVTALSESWDRDYLISVFVVLGLLTSKNTT